MSHAQAWVRFESDGLIMFAEYDGTCDIILTPLYSTFAECQAAWRDGARAVCVCARAELAEYAENYGGGSHGPVQACRHCKAITDTAAFDPQGWGYADGPNGGLPGWVNGDKEKIMTEDSETLGCSDGNCDITGRAEGMHTNGGCKCLEGLRPLQRRNARATLDGLRAEVERLTAERDAAARARDLATYGLNAKVADEHRLLGLLEQVKAERAYLRTRAETAVRETETLGSLLTHEPPTLGAWRANVQGVVDRLRAALTGAADETIKVTADTPEAAALGADLAQALGGIYSEQTGGSGPKVEVADDGT